MQGKTDFMYKTFDLKCITDTEHVPVFNCSISFFQMENDKQHLGANLVSVAVVVEIGIISLNYTLPSVARFKRITFITLDMFFLSNAHILKWQNKELLSMQCARNGTKPVQSIIYASSCSFQWAVNPL